MWTFNIFKICRWNNYSRWNTEWFENLLILYFEKYNLLQCYLFSIFLKCNIKYICYKTQSNAFHRVFPIPCNASIVQMHIYWWQIWFHTPCTLRWLSFMYRWGDSGHTRALRGDLPGEPVIIPCDYERVAEVIMRHWQQKSHSMHCLYR